MPLPEVSLTDATGMVYFDAQCLGHPFIIRQSFVTPRPTNPGMLHAIPSGIGPRRPGSLCRWNAPGPGGGCLSGRHESTRAQCLPSVVSDVLGPSRILKAGNVPGLRSRSPGTADSRKAPGAGTVSDHAHSTMAPNNVQAAQEGVIDEEKGLHRTMTGVTMSPELFEKACLSIPLRCPVIPADLH